MLNIYRITFRWGTSKDFEKMQFFDYEADHKHAKRGGGPRWKSDPAYAENRVVYRQLPLE